MRYSIAILILSTFPAPAQTTSESYRAAIEALELCETTWFQTRREEALDIISESGTFIATRLNPLSRTNQQDLSMLEAVTAALRRCREITYPESQAAD